MSTTPANVIVYPVLLDRIDPPDRQHRATLDPTELGRLADSLAADTLLQPVGVVEQARGDRYTLVWGWRRYSAAKLLGWVTIDARVFPVGYDADRARAVENEFRTDLNAIERAEVCEHWRDGGMALTEIARRWRREVSTIQGWLALLKLPEDLRQAVGAGQISAAVAVELARVDFGAYRQQLLDEAIRAGATLRVVAAWTAAYAADRERVIANTVTVQEILQAAHRYRVKIVCEACGAEVPIEESRTFRVCAADYALIQETLASP